MSPLTLRRAQSILRKLRIVLNSTPSGEFRVNFITGSEATAYYTSDLDDALETGIAMAERGHQIRQRNPGKRKAKVSRPRHMVSFGRIVLSGPGMGLPGTAVSIVTMDGYESGLIRRAMRRDGAVSAFQVTMFVGNGDEFSVKNDGDAQRALRQTKAAVRKLIEGIEG